MCCQVEVSASGWSLVQRSPTECGVCDCDRETSVTKRVWSTSGAVASWTRTHTHTHTYNPQSSESKLWSLFENVASTFIPLTLCLFIYFRICFVSILPSILQNISSIFVFSFLKCFPSVLIILPDAYILNMLSIIHYHCGRVSEITFSIKCSFSHLPTHLIIYVTF